MRKFNDLHLSTVVHPVSWFCESVSLFYIYSVQKTPFSGSA